MVKTGEQAPDFTMEGVIGHEFTRVSLSDYKGKWIALFFYPHDFDPAFTHEIEEFSRRADEFKQLNTQILGTSVDSKYSHLALTKEIGLSAFPLLSDITRDVSRSYGALAEDKGFSIRSIAIIDPDGVLRWVMAHNLSPVLVVDCTIRTLGILQNGNGSKKSHESILPRRMLNSSKYQQANTGAFKI